MEKEITLKTLIEGGRESKNISQRELARRIGLSNTSLNDLEKGKVKKPDVEMLRRIAEELDLSLQQLLNAAGYDHFSFMFSNDEFINKSSRDLKNLIKEFRRFKFDILDWDNTKRNIASKSIVTLDRVAYKLELIRDNRGIDYTLDEAIEEIKKEIEELEKVVKKYDYGKLPYDL